MRKSWPILVLSILVLGIVCVSYYTSPRSDSEEQGATNSAQVSNVPGNKTADSAKKEQTSESPPRWRRLFAWPNGIETLGILLTLIFIAWQALLTRQAITSAETSSQIELRAYVVVSVDTGRFQERDKGLKFQGSPIVTNSGKTPAHKLRWRTNSTALNDNESGTYSFPRGEKEIGGEVLGVGQTMRLAVVYSDFYDAIDVEDIKLGAKGRAFYYWGVISYEDAFGEPRTTEFCHRISFFPDPDKAGNWKVDGQYVAGRNKAT